MANLQSYEPKVLSAPSKEDKAEAHSLHAKILALLTEVKAAESELEHNYVTLGQAVYRVQLKTHWLTLGYTSWREYFDFLQSKFGKGRTQLYGYLGTIKALSDHVDDKDLVDMGISKAGELKKAVTQTGKSPSKELIEKAINQKVTVQEFRQDVMKEFHITDHNEGGTWFDLKGVYFTPEEKETWEKAIDLAKNQDPVISITLPGHAQFKEALMRLAEEFIGTYDKIEDPTPYFPSVNVEGFNEVFKEANSSESELEDI